MHPYAKTNPIVLGLALLSLSGLAACGSSNPSSSNVQSGGASGNGGASTGGAPAGGTSGNGGASGAPAGGASGSAGQGGAAGAGQGGAPGVIDQVISSPGPGQSEHEPSIVVTAKGRVVMAWISAGVASFQIGYRVSSDGGATWSDISLLPLDGDQNIAANTSLTAAPDGTVYLAYGAEHVDASGNRSHVGVYLATLGPTETKFGDPVEVTDPNAPVMVYDQPFVAVTSRGLFLGYGEFDATGTSVLTTRFSTDGGKTWKVSAIKPASLFGFLNGVQLCRPPSGDRAYLYAVDSDLGLALWSSGDGGQTWSPPIQVEQDSEGPSLTNMREGNCVAEGNDVYILYGLSDDLSQESHNEVAALNRLVLAHSADGGKTIASRVDVADPAAGSHYLLSRLAAEDNGALDVTYYAGSGEGDTNASYRFARSTDGGKSFSASVAVRKPVLYELLRTTPQWLGDYMGLTWQSGRYFAAFVDNSSPNAHVVLHVAATPSP